MAEPRYTLLDFDELKGWADDDHQSALDVYTKTAGPLTDPAPEARRFFETHFCPVLIEDGTSMLFTGYYEPELTGSRDRGGVYQYPVYGVPADLVQGVPYHTRRQIDEAQALAGRGLELAWLADPVDLFFLQVQGSGRITFPDSTVMRVGFGAKNGHHYTSIGKVLVDRGAIAADQISAAAIRAWVLAHGAQGRAVLWENESYVFFRDLADVPADQGPLGAMNRPITAGRSIAVDPAFVPLGSPVWIEKDGAAPMRRLMVAQDTGSAIKGAQRADIFFGTGENAGSAAGAIKDGGRMVVLLSRAAANSLLREGQ